MWNTIPGCPGYEASSDGLVINSKKGRIKSQQVAGNGAKQVKIGKSIRMVHDLVARAFYGHPLVKGYRVRHLNGDLADNRSGNLAWTGSPAPSSRQPAPAPRELDLEYDKVRLARLVLIDLMQS